VAFGLIPVFKYGGPQLAGGLREGGRALSASRERHRARNTLVVVQMALALVLMIGSGLMLRTFEALHRVQPGFTNPEEILTLRVSIPAEQVKDPERVARMYAEMQRKISEIPGVTSVAMTNSITTDGNHNNDPLFAADKTYAENQLPPIRRYKHVSPGLFKTMGQALIAGRDISWNDVFEARPVVIVSANLAKELWGSPAAALGKRVRETHQGIWREVIGVVGNELDDGAHKPAPTIVYWPLLVKGLWGEDLNVRHTLACAIRSQRAGSGFLSEIQRAVWSVNADAPIADVRTVEDIYRKSMARTSFTLYRWRRFATHRARSDCCLPLRSQVDGTLQ